MKLTSIGAFAIIGTVFAAGIAVGQQGAASRREPQFENSEVMVWKSIVQPNQPLALHRHEHGRALISLNGGTLNVVDGSGKTMDTYKLEAACWPTTTPAANTVTSIVIPTITLIFIGPPLKCLTQNHRNTETRKFLGPSNARSFLCFRAPVFPWMYF